MTLNFGLHDLLNTLYFRQNAVIPGGGILIPFNLKNVFKIKISCSSVFDSVSVIGDYSKFVVNHNVKVSPSARRVSDANATCKDIDIFNRGYISLTDIL
jgi:hypothetical protein